MVFMNFKLREQNHKRKKEEKGRRQAVAGHWHGEKRKSIETSVS